MAETGTDAMANNGLPLPAVNAESQAFWDAATDGRLVLQRCGDCAALRFPPRATCPSCGSDAVTIETASGRGTIFTFTVNHRAPTPAFKAIAPYVIALVDLAEGPRLMMNVVDCEPADVEIGAAVQIVFEPRGDLKLPQARLA